MVILKAWYRIVNHKFLQYMHAMELDRRMTILRHLLASLFLLASLVGGHWSAAAQSITFGGASHGLGTCVPITAFGGVDPAGNTDSTAGIQAAINLTPSGGALCFPTGIYRISGAGTGNCLFNRTTPIRLIGEGYPLLLEQSNIPSTTSIICLNPSAGQIGYQVSGLYIEGGFGNNGIQITASTSGTMSDSIISDNVITVLPGGVSIYVDNVTSPNVNGGAWQIYIQRNYIDSMSLPYVGDGILIESNSINNISTRNGIYAYLAPGAGNLKVFGNVIAVGGGAIVFDGGVAPIIANNEIETPLGVTNAHGSLIDISSAVGTTEAMLRDNQIQVLTGTGNPVPVHIGANSADVHITGGRIGNLSGAHINIAAGATNTKIDQNMIQFTVNNVAGLPSIADSGTGTVIAPLLVQPGTVAALPACNAAAKGWHAYVTDASQALRAGIGAVVAGGSSNNVPVGCDGTNWRIGG